MAVFEVRRARVLQKLLLYLSGILHRPLPACHEQGYHLAKYS